MLPAFAAILLFGGCAADEHARKLAFTTSQSVATYESAVDSKVSAEKAFYHSQLDTLRKTLGGNSQITDPENGAPAPIEKTLVYGKIRTAAERDARIAAEGILLSKDPAAMQPVIAYLETGLSADQAAFREALARQRLLATRLEEGLEPVQQQTEQLAAIRKQLVELSKKPGLVDQLKEYYAFGKAVSKELKKKKE